jgi:hypothetical protein
MRELASLVPDQERWLKQFSAAWESLPAIDLAAVRSHTFDLDRSALLWLTAPVADDGGPESSERAASAVSLLTEIVVRTPIPDDAATVDTDEPEARLIRFVVWWRGLNPAAQLTLALVFQWLTLGLAAEYLRAFGMLPGLDPEHPDIPE